MSNINLTVQFTPIQGTIYNLCSYARIDNTVTPVFINAPNIITSPTTIATNIPNGQYQINLTPVYPDGRTCQPTSFITPACPGLISISAYISSGALVVNYLAPSGVPQVQINVGYPNGGSYSAMYVNNGNPISIALPSNLVGDFTVTGQSVCDPVSGFYSVLSQTVTVSITQPVANTYFLSNNQSLICTLSAPITLYTSGAFAIDSTLFTDATLSTPVLGYPFVMINNVVYYLDATTGVVGQPTGLNCSIGITGTTAYSTGIPTGAGSITAPPGGTVNFSLTANGPAGGTYTLQIVIQGIGTFSATNGTNTYSFVMPGTGTVSFSGNYTSTNSSGGAGIALT